MTYELDTLKIRFQNANFTFKKFDVSSKTIETKIETKLKWQDKKKVGLRYDSVPPLFNHN